MRVFGKRQQITAGDLKVVEDETARLLRAQDFGGAGKFVLREMQKHSAPYYNACKPLAERYIGLDGWDDLTADIIALDRKGRRATAVGFDISGHGEGDEPTLEASLYDDTKYRFSSATRASLLSSIDKNERSWLGSFLEIDNSISLRGLAPAHEAIAACTERFMHLRPNEPAPADWIGCRLATWYLYGRTHWAIAQHVEKYGLPHPMPVIVGEHDFGLDFVSAYMAKAKNDRAHAADKILNQRAKKGQRHYEQVTQDILRDFVRRRQDVLDWPLATNSDKRQNYVEFAEAHDALVLSGLGVDPPIACWRMNDDDFKALLRAIRDARDARRAA